MLGFFIYISEKSRRLFMSCFDSPITRCHSTNLICEAHRNMKETVYGLFLWGRVRLFDQCDTTSIAWYLSSIKPKYSFLFFMILPRIPTHVDFHKTIDSLYVDSATVHGQFCRVMPGYFPPDRHQQTSKTPQSRSRELNECLIVLISGI